MQLEARNSPRFVLVHIIENLAPKGRSVSIMAGMLNRKMKGNNLGPLTDKMGSLFCQDGAGA